MERNLFPFFRQLSSSPCHDYFYSLKNVTFCGFHPFDSKYFGFVTKHPRCQRYKAFYLVTNKEAN
jgi:hypothetical protein